MTMLGFLQDNRSRPTAATPVVRIDGTPDINPRCPLFAAREQHWTTASISAVLKAVNSEALAWVQPQTTAVRLPEDKVWQTGKQSFANWYDGSDLVLGLRTKFFEQRVPVEFVRHRSLPGGT
jgi:hypothetical protein